ncbi:MAG: TM0106 family RecB-like putative nuclease, partial [Gammaproteobacteria bacterium]
MQKYSEHILYSPSDLTRFMDSPFASWMDRCALEQPEWADKKDPEDALMSTLQQKGYAHEASLLAHFVEQGCHVVTIGGDSPEEKDQATRKAMQEGVDVIVQARLAHQNFAGFADFLVKVDGPSDLGGYHYEVWDAKLAQTLKPHFIIQLCCYAEMLEAMQGRLPSFVTVALGQGERVRLSTQSYYAYYQQLKQAFLTAQEQFTPDVIPDPAESRDWGNWSQFAQQYLLEQDHLLQVANITQSQIRKLHKAGITTLSQLAETSDQRVPGLNDGIFRRLKAQAAIQLASRGQATPKYEILVPEVGEASGLALLPPASPLDVFFDIEGFPLVDGGLEYLWGNTYFDEQGVRQFKDFWAHTPEQEKQAFEAFIHWVYDRWQQDPTMHIYHYAHYEIAACRKLMGRYGVCEYEVDQLLRNEVFVDLYKIVLGGVLLGEPRYSIKNVEHLYRGKRETEVGSGGDSVVMYELWRARQAQGEEGQTWQSSKILRAIRDYNIDDCNSTQELVDWLRQQQQHHNIVYLGREEIVEQEQKEEITRRTQLRDRLLTQAEQERAAGKARQATLTENLAWVLEFHRREAKPVFWRLFDRLGLDEETLFDDLDCLAGCKRTEREPFKPTPRARNLAYVYRFDPEQAFKGVSKQFYVLGQETDEGKRLKVTYLPDESDLQQGQIVLQCGIEPPDRMTLIPDEYVKPDPIPRAIEQVVERYASGKLKRCAIVDFLNRDKPRIQGHDGGPIVQAQDPRVRLEQIIQTVRALDHSYLPIQGPPGSGKSYTGKHVIAELLKEGARIGITSNSHKAINHLLVTTARYCQAQGIEATFTCTQDTGPELAEAGIAIVKNAGLADRLQPGCVIGTTAWGFAREELAGQLDYLFVDEAGQVSVANLIAMSASAENLILMGDQMQLGQPSQGVHPAESGHSILDYLLHDSPTIRDDMGVFLGTTYRMHSAVNRFISQYIYDGKLQAHPDNDHRVIQVPQGYQGPLDKEAGIVFVPVSHEGNTQASEEEVAAIQRLAQELLGRNFTPQTGVSRPIGWNDMLFVAPYNHQVSKLKQALGEQARVGSVDKFQGQEAPIVFLSLCASDAN